MLGVLDPQAQRPNHFILMGDLESFVLQHLLEIIDAQKRYKRIIGIQEETLAYSWKNGGKYLMNFQEQRYLEPLSRFIFILYIVLNHKALNLWYYGRWFVRDYKSWDTWRLILLIVNFDRADET